MGMHCSSVAPLAQRHWLVAHNVEMKMRLGRIANQDFISRESFDPFLFSSSLARSAAASLQRSRCRRQERWEPTADSRERVRAKERASSANVGECFNSQMQNMPLSAIRLFGNPSASLVSLVSLVHLVPNCEPVIATFHFSPLSASFCFWHLRLRCRRRRRRRRRVKVTDDVECVAAIA